MKNKMLKIVKLFGGFKNNVYLCIKLKMYFSTIVI